MPYGTECSWEEHYCKRALQIIWDYGLKRNILINGDKMEEMIDVVDKNNRVIGEAPRKGIHKTDKMHRAVHIFLFDKSGRMWLELRSADTDTFPLHYNSAAAGHVSKGESTLNAAIREVDEELGVPVKLKMLYTQTPSEATANEFITLYVAMTDKEPRKHEMTEKLERFTIPEIDKMISSGVKVAPSFLTLYNWWKENGMVKGEEQE